jgi:hypothetical protein
MRPVPYKNFLILKLPRTGSTYLAHLLRQHPQVAMHSEYLNRHAIRRARVMRGPLAVRGVRTMAQMVLRRAKWRDLGRLLRTSDADRIVVASVNPFKESMSEVELRRVVNEGTRIIVLTRENLLKQHISHLNVLAEKAAGTKRPYKSYNDHGHTTRRTFYISPDAVAEIERLDCQRESLLRMVAGLDVPMLFLTYEQHINVESKEPARQALADFLEVESPDVWTKEVPPDTQAPRFHKLVSDDLREVIENYKEIAGNKAIAKFL